MNEGSDQDMIRELVKVFGKEAEKEIKGSFDHKGRYGTWGKSGAFEADGEEYNWIESEDEAERIALKMVEEDLESEPEIFNQDWLQGFLSVQDAETLAQEEAESQAEGQDFENDDERETWVEDKAKEIEKELEDPIQYFVHDQGIYTVQDLMKQHFISIDIKSAAQDAIDTDGVGHFISLYDGEMNTTTGGIVYFRE